MKKALLLSFFAVAASTASAAARLVETQVQIGSGDSAYTETYYSVEITGTGVDVGRPGAFYVGAVRNNAQIFYLGSDGWQQYKGGMGAATEMFPNIPGTPRYYHPITGVAIGKPINNHWYWGNQYGNARLGATKMEVCGLAGMAKVDLWAGIGSLSPDKEEMVQTWHREKNPLIDPNHIRNVYVQTDMQKNQKYWQIGTFNCIESGGA
jgi:hypothetical protein